MTETQNAEANLGETISQMVAKKLDAAFVETVVETRISKLVAEAVDSALRSYSDTGKLIEKAVTEALRVDRVDLSAYGHVVASMLKAQIEAKVSDLVAGRLAADMDELLGLAPKEVKLSKIAEEMLERHKDDGKYGEAITVIVERTEYKSVWVYLDETEVHSDREKYKCDHRLLIGEDGIISHATIGGQDLKKAQTIGRAYGLDQKLRAYVACGTKIIIDEDFVVTGVGDY